MSRETLPSGKVRVRVVVRGKRRTLGVYATDHEAARMESAHNVNLAERTAERPDGQTLRAFARAYLDDRELRGNKRGRRVKNLDGERSLFATHIETAEFIDWPIESLRTFDVEQHVRELASREVVQSVRTSAGVVRRPTGRTLSASSIRHVLRVLHQVLDAAVSREIVPRNVADGVSAPHADDADDCWTFLTADEIALIDRNVPEPYRTPLLFAIYMGPRQMELWRLRRGDVDLESGWLTVREGADGSTKSGAVRKAPLLPQARALIEAWLARTPRAPASALLFPRADGEPYGKGYDGGWDDRMEWRPLAQLDAIREEERAGKLRVDTVDRSSRRVLVAVARWRTKAGIARPVRFHDLRHSCASHLVQGTWGRAWRLEEVRDFLGHSSISVTQRYAHLSPDGLLRAARETFGSLPPSTPPVAPASVPLRIVPTERPRQSQPHEKTGETALLLSRRSRVRLAVGALV